MTWPYNDGAKRGRQHLGTVTDGMAKGLVVSPKQQSLTIHNIGPAMKAAIHRVASKRGVSMTALCMPWLEAGLAAEQAALDREAEDRDD